MKTEQELLSEVLSELRLNELPEEVNENTSLWVRAIALVLKKNGSKSFVLMKRDERFNEIVFKDYGDISTIFKVLNIYPYELLNMNYVQGFKNNNKKQRVEYLNFLELPYAKSLNFSDMDVDELNKELVCAAIYIQNEKSKGNDLTEKVKEYRNEYIVKETTFDEAFEEEPRQKRKYTKKEDK